MGVFDSVVAFLMVAIPLLFGTLKLYNEFMTASDRHRERKEKEVGETNNQTVGDLMKDNYADEGASGGNGDSDPPIKKPGG